MWRKTFLLLLTLAAGLFLLAWIDALPRGARRRPSRPDRRHPRRGGPQASEGTRERTSADTGPGASRVAPATREPAAPGRCRATTKSGKPCSRPAEPGSEYCWQHG